MFLLHVLYRGNYPARAAWVLLMYTMGSVAVARIAIEQDRKYSIGYALALGLAAFVVLAGYLSNVVFCLILLVVIGYLADRIVHDCTLIDDSQDASGQGLIDVGSSFFKDLQEQAAASKPDASQSQETETENAQDSTPQKKRCKRKGHQPGRTVMYLAMGALPMFGLGQFLLKADGSTWGTAQRLLMLYLFSALSLLVTTSFLGLRRYLRQRNTDMPQNVSIAWIAGGVGLIGAILFIAYLAPLPGQALSSIKLPEFMTLTSKEKEASQYGWGDEAAEKKSEGAATTRKDKNPEGKDIQSQYTKKGAKPGDTGDGDRKKGAAGKKKGGKSAGGDKGKDQQGKGDKGSKQNKSQGKSESQSKPEQQEKNQGGERKSEQSKSGSSQQQQKKKASDQQNQNSQSKSEQEQQGKSGERKSSDKPGEQPDQDSQNPKKSNDGPKQESSEENEPQNKPENQPQDERERQNQQDERQSKDERQSEQEQEQERRDESEQQQAESEGSDQSDQEQSDDPADQSEQETEKGNEPDDSSSSDNSESSNPLKAIGNLLSMISGVLRYLIMAVLISVVGYYLWKNRDAILLWWQNLFNRQQTATSSQDAAQEEFLAPEQPKRPFSTFKNPIGREKDPRKIVVVTFQAFDAWAREQGQRRRPDETPTEFIRRVANSLPNSAQSASNIVDAYNRIVYGRGKAMQADMDAAAETWAMMQSGKSMQVLQAST